MGLLPMKNVRQQRLKKQAPTLSVALARYVAEVAKPGSRKQAHSLRRIWSATRLGNRSIAAINHHELQGLVDEWLISLAASTICRRFAVISHMYNVAKKLWALPWLENPVSLVLLPAVDDARDRRIFDRISLRGVPADECPRSELDWILNATRSKQLPTIVHLAVETGMRRGEIAGIRREHIDLTAGWIYLPKTKNGSSRYVPLSPWAKYVLRLYVYDKPRRGRIFGMDPDAITKTWIRAVRMAKANYEALCTKYRRRSQPAYFYDLRFHDLRHEATSRLAKVLQIHELAKVTGHKDTRMLLRYYHPRGGELAQKIARSDMGRKQIEHIKILVAREDRLAA